METTAHFICNYNPNIPIATDAERITICRQVDIPTVVEVADHQSLLNQIAIRDHEIQHLKEKYKQFVEACHHERNKGEQMIKEREQTIARYEESIYKILPTENKAFIISDYSGLKKDTRERIANLTKKDILDQKRLLSTMAMRHSRSNMIFLLNRDKEASPVSAN
jgi:hypothetical protein